MNTYNFGLLILAVLGISCLYHFTQGKQRVNTCDLAPICIDLYMKGRLKKYDKGLIELIREEYLYRPTKIKIPIIEKDFSPPWNKLLHWDEMQQILLDFFMDMSPGIFVEIGPVDGFFMSSSLNLENSLNWTGLLIEPDTRNFEKLLQSGRNATYCPFCVLDSEPSANRFWQRNIDDELPEHFKDLLSARSILNVDIMDDDEIRGKTTLVPCAPLSTILLAAGILNVDLLSMSTGDELDHLKITDVTRGNVINAKTILLRYPPLSCPEIPGYIVDAVRSQLSYRFYIKKSYCKLIDDQTCVNIQMILVEKACLTYECFGFLIVHAIDPKILRLNEE